MDIHERPDALDKAYFRAEPRGSASARRLEEVAAAATPALPPTARRSSRCAACSATSPSSAAVAALCDYIVFGAFQWVRVISTYRMLEDGDVVADWFERCLDLHGGWPARCRRRISRQNSA